MIGAHGQAVLRMLVEHAVANGKLPPGPRNAAPPSPPVAVSLWVRMWQQRLATWLHITLSRQVLRYLAPSVDAGACYSYIVRMVVPVVMLWPLVLTCVTRSIYMLHPRSILTPY